MNITNKSQGTNFEHKVAWMLKDFGYWVHELNANAYGQPADIIALRDGKAFLLDAKDCKNGIFPLSRVEENQKRAMMLFIGKSGLAFFVLKFPNAGIRVVNAKAVFQDIYRDVKSYTEEYAFQLPTFSEVFK